jgi:hypothetical protein
MNQLCIAHTWENQLTVVDGTGLSPSLTDPLATRK